MTQTKKSILIIGVSSFVGINVATYLKKNYRIIGTYFSTPVKINGVMTFKLDITNKIAVENVIMIFRPDIVVYCAGLSSLHKCLRNPAIAEQLNTTGVFNITTYTERFSTKFIYFSSPLVFSGDEGNYNEKDSPLPITVLGANQASTEFYIQKSCLNYLIFRTSFLFGRGYSFERSNFLEFLENKFFYRESFYCDDNLKIGYFNVLLLCKILGVAIENNVTNRLFQVSSKESITQFHFASLFAKIFEFDTSLILKKNINFPVDEAKFISSDFKGNLNFSMNIDNVESYFNIVIPTVEKMLLNFYSLYGIQSSKNRKAKFDDEIKYI
ncbi:MAG: sugar nucleotide-binding protein [Halobacteriovoraceae bacterium]|nr:sugar nucleotide-binding protein [Halobacteriovoraceae bacterium]